MRQRPIFLVLMSVLLAGVGFSMPVQIMCLYGHGLDELDMVFAKMTFFNWLVMLGAFGCSLLAAQASPHLRRALPALTALVALNNFFVGLYAIDYSPWTAFFATLSFGSFNVPLLKGPLRELIDSPDKRWWRHASRHRITVPIVIGSMHRTPVRAETFDLSESGVFVALEGSQLTVDDLLTVRLTFGSFSQVRCEARVVRQSSASGMYPSGFGLQFLNMDPRQRQELRRHLGVH